MKSFSMLLIFKIFLGAPPNLAPGAASLRDVAWTVLPSIFLLSAFILDPPPPYTNPGYAPAKGQDPN